MIGGAPEHEESGAKRRRLKLSKRPAIYKRRPVQIGAAILAIPVLLLAWWLGSPLLIDDVVNEPFPRAAMAVIPDGMSADEVEEAMIEAETVDIPAYEDMPEMSTTASTLAPPTNATSVTVNTEAVTDQEPTGAGDPSTTTSAPAEEQPTETVNPSTTTSAAEADPEPQPRVPVPLVTGPLMDGDSFHQGSGQVTLYRLEDQTHLIRLEDIEVTNGPALHVLLTPIHGLGSRDDLQAAGYVDLGPLKGNIGSQNYPVPADYRIPDELTLVIYCVPFRVVFATAELA